MANRNGVLGILIGATIGTLFLVPAPGAAQDAPSVACVKTASSTLLDDLTRCAEQGLADAQFALGEMYNQGVLMDRREAERWYRLAAEQGHAVAQFRLGGRYNTSGRVEEDDAEAVRWYQLSADQGYARAQFMLAFMYTRGYGVERDLVLAHMWNTLSSTHCMMSFSCDLENRSIASSNKEVLEGWMTPGQIAESVRLSLEWVLTHPEQGSR